MSNDLEYKGFRERTNHYELIWQHLQREDFVSKIVRVYVSKIDSKVLAFRLSDTDIGSAFVHLSSNRTFVHRWETEEEAQGTTALSKHFTATLAKPIIEQSAKKKTIAILQKSIIAELGSNEAQIADLIANLHKPMKANLAPISDLKRYLRTKYKKPQAKSPVKSPLATQLRVIQPTEVKAFTLKRSFGEKVFNGFLKGILVLAILLIAMVIYMLFSK